MIAELSSWMNEKGYATIADFKGKMSRNSLGTKDEWVYKRTQYIKILMQSSEELMKNLL
jgi:dihydroorotate dehydrogenase (fumarate)